MPLVPRTDGSQQEHDGTRRSFVDVATLLRVCSRCDISCVLRHWHRVHGRGIQHKSSSTEKDPQIASGVEILFEQTMALIYKKVHEQKMGPSEATLTGCCMGCRNCVLERHGS
jgi:hypothetical protein